MSIDRVKAGLYNIIRGVFPRIDYLALYPGKVVSQRTATTFDFVPDNPKLSGLSGIPMEFPFPGFNVTLDVGSSPRALLGFEEGDPQKPRILLWEAAGLSKLVVQAETEIDLQVGGAPATLGVARLTDTVSVSLTVAEIAQIISGGPGSPCSGGPISITGTITGASSTVKASS